MFPWAKKSRRRKILARPLPDAWKTILRRNVWHYRFLDEPQQTKLHRCVQIFVAEKFWEGCDGFQIDDLVKVTVAGAACLLLLGVADGYYFDRVRTILVYPSAIDAKPHPGQLVVGETDQYSGQAWQGGPIILSWSDTWRQCKTANTPHNVVIHEFAHHIDGLDGEMGGTPPLGDRRKEERWHQIVEPVYRQLVDDVQNGRPTVLDPYAATNRAEFFAVASETFYGRPDLLQRNYPDLYDQLRNLYQIDPAQFDR